MCLVFRRINIDSMLVHRFHIFRNRIRLKCLFIHRIYSINVNFWCVAFFLAVIMAQQVKLCVDLLRCHSNAILWLFLIYLMAFRSTSKTHNLNVFPSSLHLFVLPSFFYFFFLFFFIFLFFFFFSFFFFVFLH